MFVRSQAFLSPHDPIGKICIPLIDPISASVIHALHTVQKEAAPPRMPDISGIPAPRVRRRYSDSYFKMEDSEWVPRIIDDPNLPSAILKPGRSLTRWRLQAECVAQLLFAIGGRVSEITGLTLADWHARGLRCETLAFNKGSNGRRVKFFRFSSDLAKLLRRYFDTERRSLDPRGYGVEEYIGAHERKTVDLNEVPLFLTSHGTALTAGHFRDYYWTPTCAAGKLDADVHQARHWYVTQAVLIIYEVSSNEADINRRLRELRNV